MNLNHGDISVSVNSALGNNAFSMTLRGEEFLWTPLGWKAPEFAGIPLLAPWANRIDGESYLANGKSYRLNPALGNLRYDANHLAIHGLVAFTDRWRTIRQDSSAVTSRLDFWRIPEWMAQFPFAHSIEITHRLSGGALEIETAVENLSAEPMPLCIGYHPYFRLPGSSRDDWRVRIAAREEVLLSEKLIPTGARRPITQPDPFPLAGQALDTVFTNLTGADFVLESAGRRLLVQFGPKYPVAIVYAPPGHDFVCIEPMTALTNAFNSRTAPEIAPGETWREIFRIIPEVA
jgi:aldose 1-epimerase